MEIPTFIHELPEDALGELDRVQIEVNLREFRSQAEALAKDVTLEPGLRAIAGAMKIYGEARLQLSELERRKGVLIERIDLPLGAATPLGILDTLREKVFYVVGSAISADARIALQANYHKIDSLLAEIDDNAPVIDVFLDFVGEPVDSVLRPASCLPETVEPLPVDTSIPAPSSEDPTDPSTNTVHIDLLNLPNRIRFEGKTYRKNSTAETIAACDGVSDLQLIVAVLFFGYEMRVTVIARFLGLHHSTIRERIGRFEANAKKAQAVDSLRKKRGKRGMDDEDHWT